MRETGRIRLEDAVGSVRGIGPARAARLAEAGIETVEDLLLYMPFRYEDRSMMTPIAALSEGERSAVAARVERRRRIGRGRGARVEVRVADASGAVEVVWFRQPWVHDALVPGTTVRLFGRVAAHEGALQLVNPVIEPVDRRDGGKGKRSAKKTEEEETREGAAWKEGEDDEGGIAAPGLHLGRLVPIYQRIGALGAGLLRRLVDAALEQLGTVEETLPAPTRRRLELIGRDEALRALHRPAPDADAGNYNGGVSAAHRRIIAEEFLAFQLGLKLQRATAAGEAPRAPIRVEPGVVAELLAALPFELTAGQRRALDTVLGDMAAAAPMHRLLQGDVGCGKTAVAGCAMLAAALDGRQAAMMVPTEILARQHAAALGPWAASQGLELACLTGSHSAVERAAALDGLARGELRLVVGTHALIEPPVELAGLGLAVVDEQHRFGVRQRAALRAKGRAPDGALPDLLVMTATPIPRSLALTVYGDLDVCTIDDMPPGRQPVRSKVVAARDWKRVVEAILRSVGRGEQAYVVAPRIEAGDDDLAAAVRLEADLTRQLPGVPIGLVHGAQRSDERLAAMQAFVGGQTQVLAATTVIEVGVDVANATLMVVGHAERFGLSQLHQLRGRVGRGSAPSTCIFIAHPPLTAAARARLQAVRDLDDGFALAEKDLELRGPGEVLGTRQAGMAGLRVGDPFRDHDLLEAARGEAERLMAAGDVASVAYVAAAQQAWRRRLQGLQAG